MNLEECKKELMKNPKFKKAREHPSLYSRFMSWKWELPLRWVKFVSKFRKYKS